MTRDNQKLALLTGAAGVLGSETARQLIPTYWQKNRIKIKKYLSLCG